MKNKNTAHKLFFLFCYCQSILGMAQNTPSPAVLTIFPTGSSAYPPVFSPFCDQVCWLDKRAFDIPTRRFLPSDSTLACLPENARHMRFGFHEQYPIYLWWEADPFNSNYCWAHDYRQDTLVLWRYNRELARQDSFVSLYKGYEVVISKPGIWISNHQELVLLDRHTGSVLNRAGKAQEGMLMYLKPWGEDVIICDKWLYERKQNRYVPFFPLPTEMEGCKSPVEIEIKGEISWCNIYNANPLGSYFLKVPGHQPITLPAAYRRGFDNILATNSPVAWFSFRNKIVSVNGETGDSLVYSGNAEERLNGNQNGRFLGFRAEEGLSFFDKDNCRFRVLNKPFGYQYPRNFTSDQRFIYLTYEDHWEIIPFEKLDSAFNRSLILEEYASFEKDYAAIQKETKEDFYSQYEGYLKISTRYKKSQNPKIADQMFQIATRLGYSLFSAPDSVMERVSAEYQNRRFDPSVFCAVVPALFRFWSLQNDLSKALDLLKIPENAIYLEENLQASDYYIDLLKTTRFSLDSVAHQKLKPDEKLYALGKVWLNYRSHIWGMNPFVNQQDRFAKAYHYFYSLLQQYPNSPWADNAAYDTMQLIDYKQQATDDFTMEGDDKKAYLAFSQFLKDYPNSDRRPDVLLRLAMVAQRGDAHDKRYYHADADEAAEYLQILAQDYPEFYKKSNSCQTLAAQVHMQAWSEKWAIFIALDQEIYHIQDSIRVNIRLKNKTRTAQTLDADFIQTWHEGQHLHLNEVRDKDCEGLWGDFLLTREKTPGEVKVITIKPGDYYVETFLLSHDSTYPEKFKLNQGRTYNYSLELRHNKLNWRWIPAQNRGQFSIE